MSSIKTAFDSPGNLEDTQRLVFQRQEILLQEALGEKNKSNIS